MKKKLFFAFVGAIALSGAVGITSCTDKDVAEVSPGYNSETGEVNVDFVFNVSTANEATTRMSAANTQATVTMPFRGITNAYLGAYSLANDGKYLTDATETANNLISLGTVINPGKINNNLTAPTSDVDISHRVLQLSLQSGTNSLLFWGKAIKNGTDLEQGKITMNIANPSSGTKISMCKIVPDEAYEDSPGINQAKLLQYEKLMASILTYIINSGIVNKEVSFGGNNKTVTINWKDYVTVTGGSGSYVLGEPVKDPSNSNVNISLLAQRLSFVFKMLNTIHAGELRAGCGQAISDMISDVMANISQIIIATPLNMEEAVAQAVAAEIETRVVKFFDKENEYEWLTTGTVKTKADFVLDGQKNLVGDDSDLNEFPSDFNLPLGSVILELAITAETGGGYKYEYNYAGTVDTYAMGGSAGSATTAFDPKNYYYPAELCYFGNSPIRVTNETVAPGDYPDGVSNWESSSSWTGSGWTDNSHVTSSTRSVAMKNNINYGTALLQTQVRYGAKTLEDNNHKLQDEWSNHVTDEPNNTIDVGTRDNHFVLTGVLIGGQNPDVGWNYIASGSTVGFGGMVYDKAKSTVGDEVVSYIQIPRAVSADGGNASEAMYSLVWDNWDSALKGQKQRDVYVALEFKNNSNDFYGENNLIRRDATFYIVGKLDPDRIPTGFKIPAGEDNAGTTLSNNEAADKTLYANHRSWGITWPDNYALPPYDTDGKGIKERRVFIQDYKTIVTFVIGPTSLQHALVAVPDLRSGQISLGLSVDLFWRTGLNFGEVTLGE